MARNGKKSNRERNAPRDRIRRESNAVNKDRRRNEEDQVEVVKLDPEDEEELYGPEGETRLSFHIIDAEKNEDEVMDEIDDFTDDEEVLQDFSERQRMINEGSDELSEKLHQHHSLSPDLSGQDIDAAWEDSTVAGEESVGGSAPTPDQDLVDELGEALGIEYEDDEPLQTADKLESRDLDRWELDPASVEELEEQEEEGSDEDGDQNALYLGEKYEGELLADEELDEDELEEEDEEDLVAELLDSEPEEDEYDEFDFDEDDLDEYLDELDEED